MTVGIDEVGRGCWAGPLTAGAVVLGAPVAGLKDSKLLSKAQRQKLAAQIQAEARSFGLGWVSAAEIDELGLTRATTLAMQRALAQVTTDFDEIIIDGNHNYLVAYPCFCKAQPCYKAEPCKGVSCLIKADQTVPAVSAASIIAKVARDDYMAKVAADYPSYQFQKHVGYGTALHRDMLALHGICDLHRLSFRPIKALAS